MSQSTIDQLLDRGVEAQNRGDMISAEEAYRTALRLDPHDPDALHLLGLVLHQTGRFVDGLRSLTAAVEIAANDEMFHFNLAEALRTAANHELANTHYARALNLNATLFQAHLPFAESLAATHQRTEALPHLMAALPLTTATADLVRIIQCARLIDATDIAIDAAVRVVANVPDDRNALSCLAQLLDKAHRYQQLTDIYPRLIAADPRQEYYVGLASAYAEICDYPNAQRVAADAIARFPNLLGAHFILGHCADRQNDLLAAVSHYHAVLEIDAAHIPSRLCLAITLRSLGKNQDSMEQLVEAQHLSPENFEVVCNISITQKALGQAHEAILTARKAVELKPHNCMITNFLAVTLHENKQSREAAALLERHLLVCPNDRDAYCNLGIVHLDWGQLREASANFARALDIDPANAGIYSNLLLTANYDDTLTPQALYDLHVNWASTQRNASPLPRPVIAPTRRRIRVGYLSPDFRTHSVVFFSCPILMNHNRDDFDVFCYSDVKTPDKVTKLLQSFGHAWRDISLLSDDQCFQIIQVDQIDILVDLAGHTAGNRLALFSARPAPIQVSLIGYPNTTGLTAMDYQITDPILHPVDAPQSFATEKLIRLPQVFACYRPPENTPPVAPLPALHAGHITFAYFNNLAKLRPFMLRAWAQIAQQIPRSRFIIQTTALADKLTCELVAANCREAGLSPDRIDFRGQSSLSQFHSDLHTIDIGLDPSPFNGHTTSCQILHMGVPVVTLAGVTRASRMGASLLTNLNLTELIAYTPEQYIRIAVDLASDLPRLAAIRSSLRNRMESSPIMDAHLYTRQLEQAYRDIWETARQAH